MAKTTAKKSKTTVAVKATSTWQSLANLIREHRAREGFSLAQLAQLTSLNEKDLAQFERGTKLLPLTSLYCLCNYLNVAPSEFLEASHGLKK